MRVLLPTNEPFELDQPKSKLIDSKMCVFEYSNPDDMDFYFKKITTFISYRYPTVRLLIGGVYRLELPLNWRILVTNSHDYICHLVPVEDLLHFENQIPVFNPYHVGLPKILDVEIEGLNPNPVEHFVPRLAKKNLLVIPVGNPNNWKTWTMDNNGIKTYYPECVYCSDDITTDRAEFGLYEDMICE